MQTNSYYAPPLAFLIGGLVFSVGCAVVDEPQMVRYAEVPPAEISDATAVLVRDHVEMTRGWKKDLYRLERLALRESVDVILAVYTGPREASDMTLRGSGKSFFVDIDLRSQKITREAQLQ